MKLDIASLKKDEELTLGLRGLYESYGYKKYRMSKFEEYELYSENKSFLSNPQVITFNDLNGKLLALKPDVTLSIGKNARGDGRGRERLYYIENVYRFSKHSRECQEISQMGAELLGELDLYSMVEITELAVKSLEAVDCAWVLDISHMGFIGGLLDSLSIDEKGREALLSCIRAKSPHGLEKVAGELRLSAFYREKLLGLVALEGPVPETVAKARSIVVNDAMENALNELESIYRALSPGEGAGEGAVGACEDSVTGDCAGGAAAGRLRLDFSIVNDISYYSGLTFQGFVERIPKAVLAGGRYDNLMKRFGKNIGAVGFALYLDQMNRYYPKESSYDVEALVLYQQEADAERLAAAVKELRADGQRVFADISEPPELRYKECYCFENGKLRPCSGQKGGGTNA